MAIILEEEKPKTNWIAIAGGLTVLIILFVGSYYLFFRKPELIDQVVPSSLDRLNTLTQIPQIDPQAIVNSSNFRALRDFTTPLPPPQIGRANPFRP